MAKTQAMPMRQAFEQGSNVIEESAWHPAKQSMDSL
jgi:hypothetical protein